jgi:hypothetical protein
VRDETETDSQKHSSTDDYATAALELEQMREAVASIKLGIILLDLHECYEKLGNSEQADLTWRSITNTLRHAANHTRIRQRLEQVFSTVDAGLQDH